MAAVSPAGPDPIMITLSDIFFLWWAFTRRPQERTADHKKSPKEGVGAEHAERNGYRLEDGTDQIDNGHPAERCGDDPQGRDLDGPVEPVDRQRSNLERCVFKQISETRCEFVHGLQVSLISERIVRGSLEQVGQPAVGGRVHLDEVVNSVDLDIFTIDGSATDCRNPALAVGRVCAHEGRFESKRT